MKHEVRVMQKQRSGNIINISSTYGHEGAAGASAHSFLMSSGSWQLNSACPQRARAFPKSLKKELAFTPTE
jgi:hypothetical protein